MEITSQTMRRLFITKQALAGEPVAAHQGSILDLVEQLGCLQLDPTNVVARSHLLVLWSRLSGSEPSALDELLWERRTLFEYWAHAASIVPTADYPIHEATLMRSYPGSSAWGLRVQEWMAANKRLRNHILRRLRAEGPLPARSIEDTAEVPWRSGGWTTGRNVERMLTFLWTKGEVCVAGRTKRERLWALSRDWLPIEDLREARLRRDEAERLAVQRSLKALGVAPARDIRDHFVRGRYADLRRSLDRLEAEGVVIQVRLSDVKSEEPLYMHLDDLELAQRLEAGEWEPRTTLLSPFDNLICNRDRTSRLFAFEFRLEIYVPKEKRRYGYFVMPVLVGDRLVARVDPVFDRKHNLLRINNIHAEEGGVAKTGSVRDAVDKLASFLGAADVAWPQPHQVTRR